MPGSGEVVVRQATESDIGGIVELNKTGNGAGAADEIVGALGAAVLTPEDFVVAVGGDRVVSTLCLLPMELGIGEVTVPAGQPEYVVTDEGYRGRGLVRTLLDVVHGWSAARGDLVQIIGGIPFFYRQFGYSYGLRRPREWLLLPETPLAGDARWEVRPAVSTDIAAVLMLQEAAHAGADVRLPFAQNLWPMFLTFADAPVLVASRGGRVEAVGRLRTAPGNPLNLQAIAAASPAAAKALIAGVRATNPGRTLVVGERHALPLGGLSGGAIAVSRRKWLYVRIADPVALMRRLVPVLNERLSRSALASESGHLDISLYRSSVSVDYDAGRVTNVSGHALPATSAPGVRLRPDLFPSLLFGAGGVIDDESEPDVDFGPHRDLMDILFPPLRTDVLIW